MRRWFKMLVAGPVVFMVALAPVAQAHGAVPNDKKPQTASELSAKKNKRAKGTIKVTLSGSGTYKVSGKRFRRSAGVSKSFKVKTGKYRVTATGATVRPRRVKVRKGKTARVTVRFLEETIVNPPPSPAPSPPPPPPTPPPSKLQRVSLDSQGVEAEGFSSSPVWSPDGSKIAFDSTASNLVPADSNGRSDIFVRTLATGAVQRVSTDSSGAQADGWSNGKVTWSPDSSRLAFSSSASNLVSADSNGRRDIFVRTLATGAVQRVSTDSSGAQVDGDSYTPVWSPDGSRIAFSSWASNLVPADSNGMTDLFVKTLATGAVQRVSTDSSGAQANGQSFTPVWSPDSNRVAFDSDASDLVADDTNAKSDVFVKTLATDAIQRVSTNASGVQADGFSTQPSWSPDGSRVLFRSSANNLVLGDDDSRWSMDIFVKTLATGTVQLVNSNGGGDEPDYWWEYPAWSPDSEHVAHVSGSSDLVPGDTNASRDIFITTLATGVIQRLPTPVGGGEPDEKSYEPAWSPDGSKIAFTSEASNLVPGDDNDSTDVFLMELP